MASLQLFTNNAVSLLTAPMSASATSLTVMAGHGDLFPQPTLPGEFFLVTLEDQGATVREIIRVTGRSGDTFTGILRGQEGTVARAWDATLGNDTLVDHRITADTMKRAMEEPVAPSLSLDDLTNVNAPAPATGQVLTWNGTAWVAATDSTVVPSSINDLVDVDTSTTPPIVGQTLTWNGTRWVPQTPTGGTGTAWIYGENTGPVNIDPGWTLPVSSVNYSDFNRGFKFYVTVLMPSNGMTKSFELMVTISGNLAANNENAEWVTYARIGYNFAGGVAVTLNKPANLLQVTWTNNEVSPVRVVSTRIQHAAA